jgi:hypothetical protein
VPPKLPPFGRDRSERASARTTLTDEATTRRWFATDLESRTAVRLGGMTPEAFAYRLRHFAYELRHDQEWRLVTRVSIKRSHELHATSKDHQRRYEHHSVRTGRDTWDEGRRNHPCHEC